MTLPASSLEWRSPCDSFESSGLFQQELCEWRYKNVLIYSYRREKVTSLIGRRVLAAEMDFSVRWPGEIFALNNDYNTELCGWNREYGIIIIMNIIDIRVIIVLVVERCVITELPNDKTTIFIPKYSMLLIKVISI